MSRLKKSWLLFVVLCITVLFNACIKSFVPNLEKYNELLVVDGNINDGPGPYTIKLSKSAKTKERAQFVPYTKCTAYVEDNAGNKITFSEKEPGIYVSDSSAVQGIPGRAYKLIVGTSDGEWYESEPDVLLKGLKIQNVYGELEHKTDPKLFFGRDGYQFYVDTETPATTDNYIFWRMQSTYKFRTDFPILCYYDNGVHYVTDGDTLRTCFRTLDILDLFLLNTNELQQKEIKRVALNYEDNYTKALTIRYSLKVSQFTINERAFNYWSTVKKIISSGGDLYTQQPFQVPNNLKNISNPDKPALGYFMVAGFSEKRIFLTPANLIIREGTCNTDSPQFYPLQWFKSRPDIWPVFYADKGGGPYYLPQECVDCRVNGTQTQPVFWTE